MDSQSQKTQPLALLAIAATVIASGAFVGTITNAINGAISPEYFRIVMRWHDVEHIWRTTIAQGIFEGLIYGVIFAVMFTLVVGIVSKGQCTYTFAIRYLFAIIVSVLACWIIGGLIGIGLAFLSPEFYQQTFYRVPDQTGPMLRYAWVGGSIWGAMLGGVLAGTIGSILFAVRWRQVH